MLKLQVIQFVRLLFVKKLGNAVIRFEQDKLQYVSKQVLALV